VGVVGMTRVGGGGDHERWGKAKHGAYGKTTKVTTGPNQWSGRRNRSIAALNAIPRYGLMGGPMSEGGIG